MKKILLFLLMITSFVISSNAVPSGTYKDSHGNGIIITDSQRLYKINSDGSIKQRYQICDEKGDGSFTLRLMDNSDNVIPGLVPSTRNGWWQENGEVKLSLEFAPRRYVRQ